MELPVPVLQKGVMELPVPVLRALPSSVLTLFEVDPVKNAGKHAVSLPQCGF